MHVVCFAPTARGATLPPLISDWNDALPEYPGEEALIGIRKYRCVFDADGMCKPLLNLKRALVGDPMADLTLTQLKPLADRTNGQLHDPPAPKSNPQDPDCITDADYDSDAPISSWACKRGLGIVHGNVYMGPVTIHIHEAPPQKRARTTKANTNNENEATSTREYLAAISDMSKVPR